ncbi:hypothetical protein HNQ85_000901 [Anoxybacillus calidus]|jgi:hypothetical protein|uniref:DUF4349 domain-containing protein n=1 Tax=[Anoxybacillus] calidus TaxID=575178 RepID=A0A7V9YY64_9BACL|nr:DUF4349 domain-containing protein [Anoxybacillus calidus]MBA2870631.1 hypothetical protein [Anoxybacillus calidus]
MKWGKILLVGLIVFMSIAGCSSSKKEEFSQKAKSTKDTVITEPQEMEREIDEQNPEQKVIQSENRMVIYHAEIRMEVKEFQKVQQTIEQLVQNQGGYIVQENVYESEDNRLEGTVTTRIPQAKFQTFLRQLEKLAMKVHSRHVTGEDVTEEFVDLESRLKSKQAVEERLYQFLKEAKDTKDLLAISNDLARVQEEIEQIKGRMKYLQNQSALSTVTIHLFENKVIVPDLENKDLNTWERTKKQFISSINLLLSLFSGLIVFIIGNLPIFVVFMILIGLLIFFGKNIVKQKK